ncbi:sulfite oxidase-like oxidoreductase [Actinomycetospora sp. NBC_00405]|uniref:sulfite oxidase-like oxidoreductase n=1 Tax=Actinomycetospora sp. NBC_00405 TaxID=2975952 RepID=UPI002E2216AD
MEVPATRGFTGRRRPADPEARIPPGQHVVADFPVLTAGATPQVRPETWTLTLSGEIDESVTWTWGEFLELPNEDVTCDIHCVTSWSKLGTGWRGVAIDTLLEGVDTAADFVLAHCDGGYTTNLPLEDLTDGRAWIAHEYEGSPLSTDHGGPARLLVPHLYFWKSAKWIRGLQLLAEDQPGFWESNGYHDYGDPWLEQRYQGD